MSRYDAASIEPKWQEAWQTADVFTAKREGDKPKYYVLEMFPVPVGQAAHGPRAQLHDGRRDRALQDVDRAQRAASDGIRRLRHARRKRRDGQQAGTRRIGPTPISTRWSTR